MTAVNRDDSDANGLISPTERLRLKRASLAHLLDLKRAGCSPKHTELQIDRKSDRIISLPARRPAPGPKPKPAPIAQVPMLRRRGST